jgi:C-terminal processing protease CtpA/Prc
VKRASYSCKLTFGARALGSTFKLLQVGDEILAVNGISIQRLGDHESVKAEVRAGTDLTLTTIPQAADDDGGGLY